MEQTTTTIREKEGWKDKAGNWGEGANETRRSKVGDGIGNRDGGWQSERG